jgi:hypothetical protein
MEYQPEQIEAFQTEETDKTSALQTLTTTIKDNPEAVLIAAEILGYDLTEEQITAIEGLKAEEPEPAPTTDPLNVPMELPTDEENMIADELRNWRTFVEIPRKREFETKHIPPALKMRVQAQLNALDKKGKDYVAQVNKVFDEAVIELPVVMLAKALNKMDV